MQGRAWSFQLLFQKNWPTELSAFYAFSIFFMVYPYKVKDICVSFVLKHGDGAETLKLSKSASSSLWLIQPTKSELNVSQAYSKDQANPIGSKSAFVYPLTAKSNKHIINLHNVTPESCIEVTKISGNDY